MRTGALRGRFATAMTWMRDDAAEWGVSTRAAWGLAIAPVAVAAAIGLTGVYRPLYRAFVDEDAIVEWAQVGVVVALIPLGLLIAIRLWRMGERPFAALFVFAGIVAFFIAGEEISWGQRILGWATPADLATVNQQGETNIHNVGNVLRFANLAMFITTFGAGLLPIAWRWGAGGRARTLGATILVPPLFLASSFLYTGVYRLIRYALIPEGRYVVARYAEVAELLFYVALLVTATLILRRLPSIAR